MFLSSKEAAETLANAEQTSRRSRLAFGYRKASPHLILWGVVWILGYAGTDLRPAYAGPLWLALIAAALVIAFFLSRGTGDNDAKVGWGMVGRILAIMAIATIFISATYTILGPVSGPQQGAFVPMLVGAGYAIVGLWLGMRFVITGLAMIALTFGGYFALHEHFLLWQAVVGGGGLILAGVWFRQV